MEDYLVLVQEYNCFMLKSEADREGLQYIDFYDDILTDDELEEEILECW